MYNVIIAYIVINWSGDITTMKMYILVIALNGFTTQLPFDDKQTCLEFKELILSACSQCLHKDEFIQEQELCF